MIGHLRTMGGFLFIALNVGLAMALMKVALAPPGIALEELHDYMGLLILAAVPLAMLPGFLELSFACAVMKLFKKPSEQPSNQSC